MFFIAAGFYFAGNLIFVLYGQGEIQPWNQQKEQHPNQSVANVNTIDIGMPKIGEMSHSSLLEPIACTLKLVKMQLKFPFCISQISTGARIQ